MQRLLNDAEKLSGVHYDLGNLADMYSAIHIIQNELGITGTTAEEAATTLTGSFSAMSAAFQNVMADLSTGEDLTEPLSALVETAQTFLEGNLLPMIGNVLAGIPEIVMTLVPQLLETGTEMVNSLAEGFTAGIPAFLENALPQVLAFSEQLRANAGSFIEAGLNFITQLLNGLIAGLPTLISYVPDIIINICGIINDNMPKILGEGVTIIVQLIAGIIQAVPSLLANWKKIFQAVLSVISAINWLNIGKNILTGIANGVKSMASNMLAAFKGGFSSALAWIKSLPSQAVQWGKNLIQSFINGLTGKGGAAMIATAGSTLVDAANKGDDVDWSSVWSDANTDIADSAAAMADVTIPAYTKSGNAASNAAKKVQKAAKTITESLQWSVQDAGHNTSQNAFGEVTTATTELTEHMLKSDGTSYDNFTKTITESGKEMVNGVLKNYKLVTKEVSKFDANGKKIGNTVTTTQKVYEEIAATVKDTVTSTLDTVENGIQTTTKTVTETLTDGTEQTKKVITETYTDIVNGALVTVEKVRNIAKDGTETTTKEIKAASADSFSGLVKGWKTEANKGVLGTFSTLMDAIKKQDWQSIGEWALSTLYNGLAPENKKLIDDFGTALVQQINKVLSDKTSEISKKAWDFGSKLADGISKGLGEALSNSNIDFSEIGTQLTAVLGSMGNAIGTFVTKAGTALAGLAESSGGIGAIAGSIGGLFTEIGSLILANPEVAAIIAIVAGVAALGAAIWAACGKKKKPENNTTSKLTYTDIQDAYWYGNERAFAGYDYRTDPYTFNPNNSTVLAYQTKMQEQLARLTDVVQQYLPDVANQQIVLDDGTLVGCMAAGMNEQLGQLQVLSERGN